MKIVIVNASGGSGKTTFEEMCRDVIGENYTLICSTIDIIKDAAKIIGWQGGKELKDRKFLSDLKDLATEYNDCSYNYIAKKVTGFYDLLHSYGVDKHGVVFIDCREPIEINKFVERLGAVTLLIRRPTISSNDFTNHADSEVENYQYDYYIDNDGTLEDLKKKAKEFCDRLEKTNWTS